MFPVCYLGSLFNQNKAGNTHSVVNKATLL